MNLKSPHSILLIFLLFAFLDLIYFFHTSTPPSWDQALHLELSLTYFELLKLGELKEIINTSGFYPPFFHISSSFLYTIFGTDLIVSRSTNIFYLLILLLSTYGIASHLFNKNVGILSALLISTYPLVISMQKTYLLDLSLTALIAATIYFLLKSDNFSNTKYTLLFAIAFSFAELTKWTAIFFIIGPVIYTIYQKIKAPHLCLYCGKITHDNKQFCSKQHEKKFQRNSISTYKKSTHKNIILAFITIFIIAGSWYIPNFTQVTTNLLHGQEYWGTIEGEPNVLTLNSLTWYPSAIPQQTGILLFALLIFSLIYLTTRKENFDTKLFMALSLLTPYIVFTLTKNKSARYTMPTLIFFSILTAYFLIDIQTKQKFAKHLLTIIIILLSIQTISLYTGDNSSSTENWHTEDAISLIQQSILTDNPNRLNVMILPDHRFVNGRTYSYYAHKQQVNVNVHNAAYLPPDNLNTYIPITDFIILKESGKLGGTYNSNVQHAYNIFNIHKSNFTLVSPTYQLPDNSTLLIYKHNQL